MKGIFQQCECETALQAAPANEPPRMVCGRAITGDPARFRPTPYRGRTINFCTEFCREAFLADPDRFYAAHSAKRPGA